MKASRKKRQPLSLRIKWGVILLISFVTLSVAGSFYYHVKTNNNQTAIYQQIHDSKFSSAMNQLNILSQPLNEETIEKLTTPTDASSEDPIFRQDFSSLLTHFESGGSIVRLYDANDLLLYETRPYEIQELPKDNQVAAYQVDDKIIFAGKGVIFSLDTFQNLGFFELIDESEELTQMHDKQDRLLMVTVSGLLIVSAVVAFWMSHYFLRPLKYLNDSLDTIEEASLSDIRMRQTRNEGEWSDLIVHVNGLLDKIDQYVTSQKAFVEDVSHELRTPVAIVEGHLKMLNRWGKNDPEILEESITASLQEITRMKGLVQEMLDLSRAENVQEDYKYEVTNIQELTEQVCDNFKLLYPDFYFSLDIDNRNQKKYARIHRNHFEQILIILLDNAVKYSTDRLEVLISLSQTFTHVQIAVQDFGEGMSEEDKDRAFDRFYRVDQARSRQKGGTGLGLSIARKLIEGYEGEIYVESVLGHGSIFYIELPILTEEEVEELEQKALENPRV